jgi:hypothetical protein
MKIVRPVLAAIVLAIAAACSSPTAPDTQADMGTMGSGQSITPTDGRGTMGSGQ